MFIHGLRDTLIPKSHAEELHSKVENISQIIVPENMDHNNFDFHEDLAYPLLEFMKKLWISSGKNSALKKWNYLVFPSALYWIPKEYSLEQIHDKINNESFMRRMMNKYS